DGRRRRFFGYLNLFLAAMLILVIADNYLLLYVGWEGVAAPQPPDPRTAAGRGPARNGSRSPPPRHRQSRHHPTTACPAGSGPPPPGRSARRARTERTRSS
ncbi:hypothetical protein DLE01_39475, partial [Streptomyces sp. FT05W]